MKEFIIGRHLNPGKTLRCMNLLSFSYCGIEKSGYRSDASPVIKNIV